MPPIPLYVIWYFETILIMIDRQKCDGFLFIYKLNEYVFDLVEISPKFVWMFEFEICFLFVTQFHFHYGVYQICIDVSDYNDMHL